MGNSPGEKACFPVRIGTYLNGERVIATNKTETELYNVLSAYDCAIIGDNAKDLAQKIIHFFDNQQERKRLEKNLLKAKKELSWDRLTDQLIKFYEKVLKTV